MKVCVAGLWHLGSVTAAYLASLGMDVVGFDPDEAVVDGLKNGRAPLFEPGLHELVQAGLASGKLRFTNRVEEAVRGCSLIWITFDTPVDQNDKADVGFIKKQLRPILKAADAGASVIISSQVPVGFCRQLEHDLRRTRKGDDLAVCYSPENLRLGKALEVIAHPDRIVVGLCQMGDRPRFEPVFSRLSPVIQWMSVESAEMTKHALNAFLANSVVFANEIAAVCEAVGANAREVAGGLLSEARIGPKAYLHPGSAFAGGTLARDIQFLIGQADRYRIPLPLIEGIQKSNQQHRNWVKEKIRSRLKSLRNKTVALLGLTYKPGTDTLRRSWAIELAEWLSGQGVHIQAYDPLVSNLPSPLNKRMTLKASSQDALNKADCAVIVTSHPTFLKLETSDIALMRSPLMIDPNGILFSKFGAGPQNVDYLCVGFQSKGKNNGASRR